MKKVILRSAVLFLLIGMAACHSDVKKENPNILKGKYHGKNIFVQNPFGPDGIGFCVSEITVNGNKTSDEVSSAAIEIDLLGAGLKEGDDVTIEIKHLEGCEPKVLNPEVLK